MTHEAPTGLAIAGAIVAPVLQALRELGLDSSSTAVVEADAVAGAHADVLLNRAAAQLGDSSLGLTLARHMPVGALGPLDYALVTSPTVREGLRRITQFYGVVTERAKLRLVEEPPRAWIDLDRHKDVDHSSHWIEFAFAMITTRLRQAVGPGFAYRSVTFVHPAPGALAPYEAMFGCHVEFDAAQDRLSFDASLLDRVLRTAAPSLLEVLDSKLQHLQMPAATEDPFLQKVLRHLRELFERRDVSLGGLATGLGISTRTLQRGLKERQTSHQQLLDALRRERAMELLDQEGKSIAEVSEALGFREPSAFFRAFRRWTGTTPAMRRREKR